MKALYSLRLACGSDHLLVFLVLCSCLAPAWSARAQAQRTPTAARSDSVSHVQVTDRRWTAPPPTGRSQKTQGLVFMAAGGLTAVTGVINMNREDPCAGIGNSPYVECASNIEDVHTVGQMLVGVGGAMFLVGVLRYGAGMRKARRYSAWQRERGGFQSSASYSRAGLQVNLSYRF